MKNTTPSINEPITNHPVVSHAAWLAARKDLLAKERELTHLSDQVNAARRDLPWEKVENNYIFEGPDGKVTLAELFGTKRQLIIYHFMDAPGWEEGCVGCSHLCDHVDAARQHFEHVDVAFAAVSRGTLAELEAYRKRMGWSFNWVSSHDSDFNYDYRVSFTPEQVASGDVGYNYGTTKLADWRREVTDLSGWIRRHMRKCFWLRWKTPRGRCNALKRLGVAKRSLGNAWRAKGAWAMARYCVLQHALKNQTLRQHGFIIPWEIAEARK